MYVWMDGCVCVCVCVLHTYFVNTLDINNTMSSTVSSVPTPSTFPYGTDFSSLFFFSIRPKQRLFCLCFRFQIVFIVSLLLLFFPNNSALFCGSINNFLLFF
uniref:Uncharacterized protein n=1 Tax=Cacopsylla melanoneura TaxID=428564 RepID=A0A8D8LWN8_9HEMI